MSNRPVITFLKKRSSSAIAEHSRQFYPVLPGSVTPMRGVPSTVGYPEYALNARPHSAPEKISIFQGKEEVLMLSRSARLARYMLDFALSLVRPGVSTEDIDKIVHEEIIRNGAYPSPINYCGFPKAICTSVNEVVCHGIPDSRVLVEGDVISIDVSLYKDGFHGDNCGTVIVGSASSSSSGGGSGNVVVDKEAEKLVDATRDALMEAISIVKPGVCLSRIGEVIQSSAFSKDFRVIHEFLGHGTGPILHMSPLVRHYKNTERLEIKKGMLFTIEPILVEGSRRIIVWKDGWTAATADGGRGAQFEHEVLVTDNGCEVLTVP